MLCSYLSTKSDYIQLFYYHQSAHHPHRTTSAEATAHSAAGSVLHHHRLQLPSYTYDPREAGAVLHPGYLDPAESLRDSGAAAGTAGGGFFDVHPDTGDCGDEMEVEGKKERIKNENCVDNYSKRGYDTGIE